MEKTDLKKFYDQREGRPVVIPAYERCDGNYPPAWLVRRQNTKIDRRIR